jgi:hypothetical protein
LGLAIWSKTLRFSEAAITAPPCILDVFVYDKALLARELVTVMDIDGGGGGVGGVLNKLGGCGDMIDELVRMLLVQVTCHLNVCWLDGMDPKNLVLE